MYLVHLDIIFRFSDFDAYISEGDRKVSQIIDIDQIRMQIIAVHDGEKLQGIVQACLVFGLHPGSGLRIHDLKSLDHCSILICPVGNRLDNTFFGEVNFCFPIAQAGI